MAKHTLKDFALGDKVYHLSNSRLLMVVVSVNEDVNEVTCRWVDKDGKVQSVEFMPQELGKAGEPGIYFSNIKRNDNRY